MYNKDNYKARDNYDDEDNIVQDGLDDGTLVFMVAVSIDQHKSRTMVSSYMLLKSYDML